MENRPGLKAKTAIFGQVDIRSGHVCRQQVRGKLDAVKISRQTIAQGFHGPGLSQAGGTFNEQVAIPKQSN